jgi:hypothetical protein
LNLISKTLSEGLGLFNAKLEPIHCHRLDSNARITARYSPE